MTEKGTGLSQKTVQILALLPIGGMTLDVFLNLTELHRALKGLYEISLEKGLPQCLEHNSCSFHPSLTYKKPHNLTLREENKDKKKLKRKKGLDLGPKTGF